MSIDEKINSAIQTAEKQELPRPPISQRLYWIAGIVYPIVPLVGWLFQLSEPLIMSILTFGALVIVIVAIREFRRDPVMEQFMNTLEFITKQRIIISRIVVGLSVLPNFRERINPKILLEGLMALGKYIATLDGARQMALALEKKFVADELKNEADKIQSFIEGLIAQLPSKDKSSESSSE